MICKVYMAYTGTEYRTIKYSLYVLYILYFLYLQDYSYKLAIFV